MAFQRPESPTALDCVRLNEKFQSSRALDNRNALLQHLLSWIKVLSLQAHHIRSVWVHVVPLVLSSPQVLSSRQIICTSLIGAWSSDNESLEECIQELARYHQGCSGWMPFSYDSLKCGFCAVVVVVVVVVGGGGGDGGDGGGGVEGVHQSRSSLLFAANYGDSDDENSSKDEEIHSNCCCNLVNQLQATSSDDSQSAAATSGEEGTLLPCLKNRMHNHLQREFHSSDSSLDRTSGKDKMPAVYQATDSLDTSHKEEGMTNLEILPPPEKLTMLNASMSCNHKDAASASPYLRPKLTPADGHHSKRNLVKIAESPDFCSQHATVRIMRDNTCHKHISSPLQISNTPVANIVSTGMVFFALLHISLGGECVDHASTHTAITP
ncbi:hypothetical protein EGR_08235 [Echinococcus granulosus]|uniref:Uncharacterized protein n=1 Tax=Echinococcus granulosus TaxID=6210 RepID=W6U6L3_ECHGR|nr:hypothetical protein EGR_08235 [Echinococcus granulosus]EUB56883.1 hypothetical protein EGR_08235 [Echinococcus granulosus]